ncbi:uncharacterized protein UHOD_11214 [Ustilago sp. UG-2017b]|nr:uncharacterized protein UHOD_11214 [Ustilago sp. UG-2017b]
MVASHRQTRSQPAASAPPPEGAATPTRRRRIVLLLHPREALAPATNPLATPVPPRVANPLASPVALSPLEPLFLGMDDNVVVPSPLPSPLLASAASNLDLYDLDARQPPREPTTPERQAAWEAELALSPTPPPTADDIIDAVLAPPRAVAPEHLPSNGEIAGWAERFVAADLMVRVADRHFPLDWEVPTGSDECVGDPVMAPGWVTAMRVVWHLPNPALVSSILQTLQDFVARHNLLYSERQPHESVAVPGGPPDPLSDWVAPIDEEKVIRLALAPPPAPSSYVDI